MQMIRIGGDGEIVPLTPGEVAATDQYAAGMEDKVQLLVDHVFDASQAAHEGDATRSAMITAEMMTELDVIYADRITTLNLICYLIGEQCEARRYIEQLAQNSAHIIGIASNALPPELRLPLHRLFEQYQEQEGGDPDAHTAGF